MCKSGHATGVAFGCIWLHLVAFGCIWLHRVTGVVSGVRAHISHLAYAVEIAPGKEGVVVSRVRAHVGGGPMPTFHFVSFWTIGTKGQQVVKDGRGLRRRGGCPLLVTWCLLLEKPAPKNTSLYP